MGATYCLMRGKERVNGEFALLFLAFNLKRVYYYKTHLMTKCEVRTLLFRWIECYYNRQRLHSANGYRPPAEKREEYFTKQAVA